MPSNTKKTELRRKRKRAGAGKKRKKALSRASTPAFEVHTGKNE
jgi:hypothetical protein